MSIVPYVFCSGNILFVIAVYFIMGRIIVIVIVTFEVISPITKLFS